ncbi:MAG: hypothetical protein ABJA67_13670 [Chthonomonadales bacterium]
MGERREINSMDQEEFDMNEASANISEQVSEKMIASLTLPQSTPLSWLDVGSKYMTNDMKTYPECNETPWILVNLLLDSPKAPR